MDGCESVTIDDDKHSLLLHKLFLCVYIVGQQKYFNKTIKENCLI